LVAGQGGGVGVASVRSGAAPLSDLPLPKAEPIRNADKKSNYATTKQSEEEGERGTPGGGAEIPPQPMEETTVK